MIVERYTRGKIIGEDVMVSTSIFDRDSYAAQEADIWQTELRTSRVRYDSKVRASLLEFSDVGCSRLPSEVVQSRLIRSQVRGGSVINAFVENSRIKGMAIVRGHQGGVKILNSTVKGHAIVEGDAILRGITVDRYMRIGAGVWVRPPRYETFVEPEMAEVGVTESIDQTAYVGCTRKPIAQWIRGKYRFGKAVRWSKEMCDRLALTLEEWADIPLETH